MRVDDFVNHKGYLVLHFELFVDETASTRVLVQSYLDNIVHLTLGIFVMSRVLKIFHLLEGQFVLEC